MNLLESLNWRYATKKFDPTKKVSAEHMEELKSAIQLAASSYGLQPYKVLIVEDQAIREQLKPASWGQSQITDASHLIVFCGNAQITPELIDDYVSLKSEIQNIPAEKLEGFGSFMKSKLENHSREQATIWSSKQTYIALANLMIACANLKIDACPMEGYETEKYDEILGLKEQGFTTTVIAAIGYRSEDDAAQHATKVRKPITKLFESV